MYFIASKEMRFLLQSLCHHIVPRLPLYISRFQTQAEEKMQFRVCKMKALGGIWISTVPRARLASYGRFSSYSWNLCCCAPSRFPIPFSPGVINCASAAGSSWLELRVRKMQKAICLSKPRTRDIFLEYIAVPGVTDSIRESRLYRAPADQKSEAHVFSSGSLKCLLQSNLLIA